ncbi:5-(carboxyamino)imidazole ribonucleotide synthase [Myxococcota bacterium]|nr:5-(carboxyamino)imidazole ribonucleotide synthase [Myxococcota bacterium]
MTAILPGSTIGILGGGQLGRMTAMAARSLGYHIRVLDPDASCAARFVSDACITAPFDDVTAAQVLARDSHVLTLEIEKIGLDALDAAAKIVPVRPGRAVLEIIQDRARQKAWLSKSGFPVGAYHTASSAAELEAAAREIGGVAFAKTCRGGYDGRGQVRLTSPSEATEAWTYLGADEVVVEAGLDIAAELSVLVARRPSGELAVYPPALNHHEERILAWSALPGPIDPAVSKRAIELARGLAEAIAIEGLLVVELFLLTSGDVLVNELAPRPHNTFHATEVACLTSQFEQLTRAVCDLPLGSTEIVKPAAIMNLLGDLWLGPEPPHFDAALSLPGVRLHLYGKRGAKPGRKMGHLSAAGATPEDAITLVQEAYRRLSRSERRG